ncbi:AraC family transcriptional regulator [Aquiflexum sp. LQ15W]|uniref:helix-turn-helix domain-containing protein n=1 Tax=Cognataquiflexum nitidum TaxID=2922272 RepID=UPI001F138C93|nr:AraC family transcriptional regulator [Cognataquiflexum nitidum]MCH6199510.1 AraC family transcriptional regulator [Cognataquiflexum nitidum]
MACQSCEAFVKEALDEMDIVPIKVGLGEIETKNDVNDDKKLELNKRIKKVGLELLGKKQGVIIEKIRKVMVDYVYHPDEKPNVNFSTLLSDKLKHSYTYLSNFFSEVEATTIEQYLISLKIERVKEMIILEEFNLSEIAFKLHYSSAAHLSNQFKKVRGLSPSHFKKLKEKRRIAIQDL